MSGLEQTFYIMAIIFMTISFLLLIALVSAVFVIKGKINRIHENIDQKINAIAQVAEKSGELTSIAARIVAKGAERAVKRSKRK
jgi:Na+-transporting methylmalonyl-CoA/oxaloacetate decarboxylase gamma subunit